MALADNKVKIQALLDGINALPEAGSGEPAEPVLQEKAVTPTKAAQSVTPDAGYDGLSKVDVGAIPDEYIVPSGTVSITENGTHSVREAENVNVNVPAPEIALQEKTVTPTTAEQSVTPDDGYDGLSKVTVEAIPVVEQATPVISVSSSGLITANVTQTGGYVADGTKSATKALLTRAGVTMQPTTYNRMICSTGRYTTGTLYVAGDTNLKAANIANGVTIFGVTGTYTGAANIASTGATTMSLARNLPVTGDENESLKTCKVTFCHYATGSSLLYSSVENGKIVYKCLTSSANAASTVPASPYPDGDSVEIDVVCGTPILFIAPSFAGLPSVVMGGVEFLGTLGQTHNEVYIAASDGAVDREV